MPMIQRCETSMNEEPAKTQTSKTSQMKHANFVFDELELVMKMTISSKTHKEKHQTRTEKKDDARMQWLEISKNDTIMLLS